MSQLVAYYVDKPIDVKGQVEIVQAPLASARSRAVNGVVRPALVYVQVQRPTDTLVIPFGEYDEWSLRDRYNEAIRIMNTLGAASIICETFGEVSVRRGLRAKLLGRGSGEGSQQRLENSGFDYRHEGAGSVPRDPRPLSWPDEPGFAAAVSSVLENGSTEVEINIRSNRSYSITGSLGVQLKGLGFDLGGNSERSDATRLSIRATFPQARRGWR